MHFSGCFNELIYTSVWVIEVLTTNLRGQNSNAKNVRLLFEAFALAIVSGYIKLN